MAGFHRICFRVVKGKLVGSTFIVHIAFSGNPTEHALACILESFSDEDLTREDLHLTSTTSCSRDEDITFYNKC
jgi:hypothetical protein